MGMLEGPVGKRLVNPSVSESLKAGEVARVADQDELLMDGRQIVHQVEHIRGLDDGLESPGDDEDGTP